MLNSRAVYLFKSHNEEIYQFRNRCEKLAADLDRQGRLVGFSIKPKTFNEAYFYIKKRTEEKSNGTQSKRRA